MKEMTVTEMNEVSGGGVRIGTSGSGDAGLAGSGDDPMPLGRVDPGGANN